MSTTATEVKTRRDWRCPAWCVDDLSDHADGARALDGGEGGALHHSRRWLVRSTGVAAPVAEVNIGQSTCPNSPDDAPEIFLDGYDFTIDEARQLALHLLAAVTIAEHGSGTRCE